MFDCHAHPGEKAERALVCTANPDEWLSPSKFPYRSYGLIPEGGSRNIGLLEQRIQDNSFVGEIGIDKRYLETEQQVALFKDCLILAKEKETLATIHYVGNPDLVLHILKDIGMKRFLIHGFTGSLETAQSFQKAGGLVSISPRLMRAKSFPDVIRKIDFVIETDMKTGKEQEETLFQWEKTLSAELKRDIGKECEERFFSYISGIKVPNETSPLIKRVFHST